MTDQELMHRVNEIYYRLPDFGPKRKRLIPDRVMRTLAIIWMVLAFAYTAFQVIDIVDSTFPQTNDSALEKLSAPTKLWTP